MDEIKIEGELWQVGLIDPTNIPIGAAGCIVKDDSGSFVFIVGLARADVARLGAHFGEPVSVTLDEIPVCAGGIRGCKGGRGCTSSHK